MKKKAIGLLKWLGVYETVIKTEYLIPSRKFKQGDKVIVKYLTSSHKGVVVGDVTYGYGGIKDLCSWVDQFVPVEFEDGSVSVPQLHLVYPAPLINIG